jgi:hypothetical protein
MRSSVKKPKASINRHIHAYGSLTEAEAAVPAVSAQIAESRAPLPHVKKSKLISHFAPMPPPDVKPGDQPPPSKPEPMFKPLKPASLAHRPKSAPARRSTADLLDRAIQHATSHEQPPHKVPKRKSHKRMTGAIVAAVVLVAVAVGAGQDYTGIKMGIADARAGFHGSLPKTLPPDYSLGTLNYGPGVISSQFQSNSGSGSYSIVQKPSNWDAQALLDNFVQPLDPNNQSVQEKGITVYLYGNHNATWVNKGVWYRLESDGSLSSNTLLKIAAGTS